MSEFTDLVWLAVHSHTDREPLPLHAAIAFSDGRLETMWADSNEPVEMGRLLWLTGVATLPADLALQIADRAAETIVRKDAAVGPEALMILRVLRAGFDGVSDDVIAEVGSDIDEYVADRTSDALVHSAWSAIHHAFNAVRQDNRRHFELDYRRRTVSRAVIDTAYFANGAGVPDEWLADMLRPFGPPSLERIIEVLTR